MTVTTNGITSSQSNPTALNSSVLDNATENVRASLGQSLFNNPLSLQGRYEGNVLLPQGVFARSIPEPKMDPDTAAVFMMALLSQVSDSQSKGNMQIIISNMNQNDALNNEIFKNMSENIKRVAEIAAQQKAKQASSDIGLGFNVAGAIFGLLGSVALAVFSLGIGAPAVIAAGLGVFQAVMGVSDRIAQAVDAQWTKSDGTKASIKISWEGMMERIMDNPDLIPQSIKDKGEDAVKKYQQDVTLAYSIGLTIAMLGASLLAGFSSVFGGASKVIDATQRAVTLGSKIGVQIANRTAQATEMISSAAETVDAASMIVSGGYGVSIAIINFDMKEADNKKNHFFAMQEALNQHLDSTRDAIAKSIENLGSAYETMSSVVADVRDVGTRGASALGRA